MFDADVYRNKRVFITGHTGFKGSWLCRVLALSGAKVTGYSLPVSGEDNRLFLMSGLEDKVTTVEGDVRDIVSLKAAMTAADPEFVFHLAAQPIVRESYKDPVTTYDTNVMGTVNFFEAIRGCGGVRSVLNVTTDKVYRNNEWCYGYRENDALGGFDPYSNSKACSELVTESYRLSFLNDRGIPVSTARAGNVIGGGDFAKDRIIPDCVRATQRGETVKVRNPRSTRPYQHVLEPLFAYLMIAYGQAEDPTLAGNYNVGPDDCDCAATGALADIFCGCYDGAGWEDVSSDGPHEAGFLKLDCSKLKSVFGWNPRLHLEKAVRMTARWYDALRNKEDIPSLMDEQIREYRRI